MNTSDRNERPAGINRRALLVGAAGAGIAIAAATAIPRVLDSEREPTVAPEASIDAFHAGDAEFFSAFQLQGALEVEHYATIEDMSTSASAAVSGKVVDVVGRTIVGEGSDRVSMVGLVIEPTLLNGELPSRYQDRLVVEFLGGSEPVRQTVAQMKRRLPKGEAVWFLRAKAEEVARYEQEMRRLRRSIPRATAKTLEVEKRYYRLVSSQGFFIQGKERIENPIADPAENPDDPVQRQARKITKMSRLAATVEGAR